VSFILSLSENPKQQLQKKQNKMQDKKQ
jgi:hypothetical protein